MQPRKWFSLMAVGPNGTVKYKQNRVGFSNKGIGADAIKTNAFTTAALLQLRSG
jgi:hypothetical protein